jgi:oxalate decarboxylase/phosphoglucose isomerase-like protein (cupin superfamily)
VITLGILITSAKTREQMSNISVYNCELIHLNKIGDRKGNITAVNNGKEIPFEIKRVFYLYDIPGGESRGAHAHKECHQFLVAASGSFEVLLDDGNTKRQVLLNRPDIGLHIPPGIWASEINFSSGSICLVLASHVYDELDYIRNYSNFLNEIK